MDNNLHSLSISSEDLIKLDDFTLTGVTYYNLCKDFNNGITELTLKILVYKSKIDF